MWMPASEAPEGVAVMTKIDDARGCRNEGALRRRGHLWWTTDGEMYVYYTPTHFRLFTDAERRAEQAKLMAKADAKDAEARRLREAI